MEAASIAAKYPGHVHQDGHGVANHLRPHVPRGAAEDEYGHDVATELLRPGRTAKGTYGQETTNELLLVTRPSRSPLGMHPRKVVLACGAIALPPRRAGSPSKVF